MSMISKNKTRLLLGASTLLATVGATGATYAATVEVAGVVTVSGSATDATNQTNTTGVTASSDNTDNTLTAGAITDGSVDLDKSVTGANAVVNSSALTIADADDAAATDTFALGTLQSSTGTDAIDANAETKNTDVTLTVGATTGSTASLSNSIDSATATTNTATQRVSFDSTTLSLGTSSASADTAGGSDVDANGAVAVGSLQTTSKSTTTATNTGSTFTLTAGAAASSRLELIGNTQSANATGSTISNAIGLSGTTVGIGAVIASQQDSDADSAVVAGTTASASLTAASLGTGSTATVSGNRIQANALSANTSNAISVNATSIALPAADTTEAAVLVAADGAVSGAFASINDQAVANKTTATVDAEGTSNAVKLDVTGGVTGGSALANDLNTLTARAQAAVTTNTINLAIGGTLSSGTAATGSTANGAVIANLQSIAGGANVSAAVDGGSADMIATTVGGVLTASSISSSANRIQAFADGALATNTLAVSATTISAAAEVTAVPGVSFTSTSPATATADTAFAVANQQSAGNATIAANIDEPAMVSSQVTGNTSESNVLLNSNGIDAFAQANKSTNSLSVAGTTIATDAGVLNVQSSNAKVSSTIGLSSAAAGADAGVNATFDGNVEDSVVSVNSNVTRGSAIGNVGINTLAVAATTLSGGGTDAQASSSGAVSGTATATGDFSLANFQSLGDTSASTTDVTASYGIDIDVGASGAAGKVLSDSRVSVSSNTQFAEAIGNTGTNRIAVTATGAGASGGVNPTAALSNVQDGNIANIDSTSKMTVFATAASDDSSVALNSNSNTALGVVNNAVNNMTVSAATLDGAATVGNITTGTNTTTADYALNSVQGASGDVDSTASSTISNLDKSVASTAGTQNSVISLNGNSTTAEGSANRISNALFVSATDNGATSALNNSQTSAATVDAAATSTVEFKLATTDAVNTASGSSISVDGNNTLALARGNSASNALNFSAGAAFTGPTTVAAIDGTAKVDAAIALNNAQSNSGAVGATSASAAFSVALNAGTGAGALNSTAKLANNAVTASGFGNVASNSLNVSTAGTNAPSAGLLNNQSNTGAVTTSAIGTSFSLALNSDGVGGTNSNAMLANNTVSSNAFGNVATNNVTMAAFGAGVPSSAVSSVQSNTAVISATATNVTFGMTVGSTSGSALRMGGNNTTAQAIGNSSVSSIGGGN